MVEEKMNRSVAYKTSIRGLFLGLALILSYIEHLIPIAPGIPGIKIGLANLIVLCLLYYDSVEAAILVNISRILLAGFLFGNMSSILYAISGAVLSFMIMILLKKTGLFTSIGISAAGGFFHNLGQLFIAMLVLSSRSVFYLFPYLAISGIIMGIFNGYMLKLLNRFFKVVFRNNKVVI